MMNKGRNFEAKGPGLRKEHDAHRASYFDMTSTSGGHIRMGNIHPAIFSRAEPAPRSVRKGASIMADLMKCPRDDVYSGTERTCDQNLNDTFAEKPELPRRRS